MRTLLNDEIKNVFEKMEGLTPGTEEYTEAADSLAKLMDREIELEKIESESDNKDKQMKEETKDRWVRNIIAAAGVIIPSALTIWGTKKTINFEETGTITTTAGRNFFNNLFRRK